MPPRPQSPGANMTEDPIHMNSKDDLTFRASSSVSSTSAAATQQQPSAIQKKPAPPTADPNAIRTHQSSIILGVGFLTAVYVGVYFWNPKFLPVARSYCDDHDLPLHPDTQLCYRPDLIAYKAASFLAMCYMGLTGFYRFHFSPSLRKEYQQHVDHKKTDDADIAMIEYRVFGKSVAASKEKSSKISIAADDQSTAILCYQIWDFVVSVTIPEHADPIFLFHHIMTGATAYYSLFYRFVPYYSIFYGGCTEVSSIFLVLLDLDTLLHDLAEPQADSANILNGIVEASKISFAVAFALYRVYGWLSRCVMMWNDCHYAMAHYETTKARPLSFLYVFLTTGVVLGALQLYWMGLIIQEGMKG